MKGRKTGQGNGWQRARTGWQLKWRMRFWWVKPTMSSWLLRISSIASWSVLGTLCAVACPGFFPSHSHLPWPYYCSGHLRPQLPFFVLKPWFSLQIEGGVGESNVPEMPRKWEPWMNSWAYWSTGSLCILTFIISVGCWCSWLMGPGAVHPSLHINYWRGVFPVIYLTVGCDKYP